MAIPIPKPKATSIRNVTMFTIKKSTHGRAKKYFLKRLSLDGSFSFDCTSYYLKMFMYLYLILSIKVKRP